jgi:multicomponent Na+:H+ antiporter subunit D
MPNHHLVILPILIPLFAGVMGLVFHRFYRFQAWLAFTAMVLSLACSTLLFTTVLQAGRPLVLQAGGWPAPFGISFVADLLSAFFVLMSQLILAAGVVYAMGSRDTCVKYPTFYPLFLFLATGLTGAFLTGDIFNLFVFVELLAISSTVLTAISDDRFGVEAAYKYFYMSQLAAFFMLLAVGALYVSCGTLNMAQLALLVPKVPAGNMLPLAVAFLMAAFMIKSATFPCHFWQPDLHTAAPTPGSAMLSSVVVKLGVYGFIRMGTLIFLDYGATIRSLLTVLGIAGIAYGGISAIGTYNVKRMLAYSTLAQVGFVLVGIGWGTALSLTAALVFAFNHSVVKSAMLMLAGNVASRASVKSASFEIVTGVGRKLPLAGTLFFLGSLGLAGIPPTNGFISKMMVFQSGIQAGQFYGLLLIGVSSTFTLVYTTRAFMKIFWQEPGDGVYTKPAGDLILAPLLLIGLVVALGIFADPLIDLAGETVRRLGDPTLYIRAVMGDAG